ncbi:MAG: 16S rRNA methyltransferase [Candidatus Heimdallarchaeota archaeon]|nr:16S rRNA methyltransferase [Candidatus Heimdallarchaeota archaeon]
MPKTTILLADSSIELMPSSLINNEIIKKLAKKRGKQPSNVILDSSYHHKAMLRLHDSKKRGRPDILHFCLLNLLGSPLVRSNTESMKIYIHTINNQILEINPETRLPKNFNRFIGLMEQVFSKKVIKTNEKTLIEILENRTIEELIGEVSKENRLIFSSKGSLIKLPDYFNDYSKEDLVLIIGAFPHGNFSEKILSLSKNIVSIYPQSIESWVVLNRVIFSREISIS